MTIDTFDSYSLAGNEMFQDMVRTSMRKIGPRIMMELTRLAATPEVAPGDQGIALKAIDAIGAILSKLGIFTGGSYGNTQLSIEELILAMLASEAVSTVTYASIKTGTTDGTLRPALDTVLYTFLREMTGLSVMSPAGQTMMMMGSEK